MIYSFCERLYLHSKFRMNNSEEQDITTIIFYYLMNGKKMKMKISHHHLRISLKKIRKNMNFLTLRKIHCYRKNVLRNQKNNSLMTTWTEKNTALMNWKEYYTFSAYY